MTSEPATLQQTLQRAAVWAPQKHIAYVRGRGTESCVTYSDLLADATALAGWLAMQGVEHGEPIVVAPSSNESFVRAFWSCLFAGAVPVPLVIPGSWTQGQSGPRSVQKSSRLLGSPRVILDATAADDAHMPPHVRAPRRRAASESARFARVAGARGCPRRYGAHPVLVGQHGRAQRCRADAPQRHDQPRGDPGGRIR